MPFHDKKSKEKYEELLLNRYVICRLGGSYGEKL